MAEITSQLLTALNTSFNGDFQAGLSGYDPQWSQVATEVPSSSKSNTYGWLGKFPRFREWVGPRVHKKLKTHGYTIQNRRFESSIGIDRDEIEDDELGVYGPLFEEMGREAQTHPDELVFELLGRGHSEICYDGQNFFDADHPVYLESDGTTDAVSVSNYDDNGGTGTHWYLMDCSRAIKPLILQNRRAPNFQSKTNLNDDNVYEQNEFRWGVDCRRNAGFSLWQLAYASRQPLTADNLWAAYSAMREFVGDGGKKLGIRPTVLVVPSSLEKAGERLLNRELESNSSNELKGKLELLSPDYL